MYGTKYLGIENKIEKKIAAANTIWREINVQDFMRVIKVIVSRQGTSLGQQMDFTNNSMNRNKKQVVC